MLIYYISKKKDRLTMFLSKIVAHTLYRVENILPYRNKYENRVGCSFNHKFVSVDDQFSTPFKSYLETVHENMCI